MKRHHRPRRLRPGRSLRRRVADAAAVALVIQQDGAGDRAWFARHPLQVERVRPATAAERVAFGLPPGAVTRTRRQPPEPDDPAPPAHWLMR